MDCNEVLERVSAYLDDELDAVESAAFQRHLDGCKDCRLEVEELTRTIETVRGEAEYFRAPDLLRARLMRARRAEAEPAPRARPGRQAWAWLGAAAAAIALVGGVWLATLSRVGADEAIAREVIAGHVRSLMASHLTDVASTDQHTVKPWFAGRLDFSPPVVDLATAGYPLVGGRLDYVANRPVAALVYQRRKHLINVFVWPQSGARGSPGRVTTRQGYHVVHAANAGMAYWVVSDLNPDELGAFARMLLAPPPTP